MSSMASDSRWNVNSHRQATSGVVLRQGGHVAEMQRRRLLLAFVEVLAEHSLENASVGSVQARRRLASYLL